VNPRQAMIHALELFLEASQEYLIIVCMDANESETDRDTVSIFDMLEIKGLTSAYSIVSRDFANQTPATYNRGTSCIDHVYVSRTLIPIVASVTIHSFGSGFNSDHRPITIQLNIGQARHDLTRRGYRTVHTQRISQAEEFQAYLAKLFMDHRIAPRLTTITSAMEEGCTYDLIRSFESLDREKGELIAAAVKRYRKFSTKTAWSRPLAKAGLRVRYWAERLKAEQHKYSLSESWRVRGRDLGCDSDAPVTTAEMTCDHREALQEYHELRLKAIPMREKHLEDLADNYAHGDEKLKAKRIKVLKKKERLRQMYQHITGLFRDDRQPISALLVPDGDIMRLTNDPNEINTILLETNKRQLQASSTSPFVSGPLSDIGRDGFSEVAVDILNGDMTHIPRTSTTTEVFVLNLAKVCPDMEIDLSSDEDNTARFVKAMAVTPEKTSSSPSGIHYGIYKVAMRDKEVAQVLSKIALTPFRYGFILDRWTKVTQVMIKKKPEPYFDKLRMIELFEGDYVAVVKSLMRELMRHLKANRETDVGTFATEKGGSTHMAILSPHAYGHMI
jgi:hypothetical protein